MSINHAEVNLIMIYLEIMLILRVQLWTRYLYLRLCYAAKKIGFIGDNCFD